MVQSFPPEHRSNPPPARYRAAAMLEVAPEVADALAARRPVVALESTIISHGLPRPDNARIAREIEDAVCAGGAVPATIALVDGVVRVGLDGDALDAIASHDGVVKCSARDLPIAAARGATGATTVAATAHVAALAGIELFATGGLGGVHREARETWDESGDMVALARTRICVVCAGVKSILDIPATLERLETLGIGVAGYRTTKFPAFYLTDSGYELAWRLDSPEDIAAVLGARGELGLEHSALIIANPLPEDEQLDPELHARVLREALDAAAAEGVRGRDVTPFLLGRFHAGTGGESLRANVALVLANGRLAGQVAAAQSAAS
jgi:pseudouridine-5'-phosphate glycosidase